MSEEGRTVGMGDVTKSDFSTMPSKYQGQTHKYQYQYLYYLKCLMMYMCVCVWESQCIIKTRLHRHQMIRRMFKLRTGFDGKQKKCNVFENLLHADKTTAVNDAKTDRLNSL